MTKKQHEWYANSPRYLQHPANNIFLSGRMKGKKVRGLCVAVNEKPNYCFTTGPTMHYKQIKEWRKNRIVCSSYAVHYLINCCSMGVGVPIVVEETI